MVHSTPLLPSGSSPPLTVSQLVLWCLAAPSLLALTKDPSAGRTLLQIRKRRPRAGKGLFWTYSPAMRHRTGPHLCFLVFLLGLPAETCRPASKPFGNYL